MSLARTLTVVMASACHCRSGKLTTTATTLPCLLKCAFHLTKFPSCSIKCLKNRHGEDSILADASGKWTCPACRGSCGPGCVTCCNCGPCRKKVSGNCVFTRLDCLLCVCSVHHDCALAVVTLIDNLLCLLGAVGWVGAHSSDHQAGQGCWF